MSPEKEDRPGASTGAPLGEIFTAKFSGKVVHSICCDDYEQRVFIRFRGDRRVLAIETHYDSEGMPCCRPYTVFAKFLSEEIKVRLGLSS